jgi:hypothetical protein
LSTAAAANSTVTTTTNPTPSVDLTSIFQNTILQSLQTVFANALNSTSQSTINNNEILEKSTQAISRIATQLQQQQSQSSQSTNVGETVAEYRPTPIAELERRRRAYQQQTVKSNIKTGNIL